MAKIKQTKRISGSGKVSVKEMREKADKFYPLLIFAFSCLLYFNSVFNNYNMDDELVTQNHRLTSKGITAIPEIFKSPYYEDEAGYKYEYRPVVLASFAIEHSFFGEHAFVSHLINVWLYALLCMLLYFVLRMLLKQYSPLLTFIIALFFVAHPIHTEVVASIKNRDEILCLMFGLLSLYFSIRFVEQKSVFSFVLIPFFFFIGIITKSTIITFALLIPLCMVVFTGASFAQLMAVAISLLIPAVVYSRLYSVAQQALFAVAVLIFVTALYYLRYADFSYSGLVSFVKEKYQKMVLRTEPEIKGSFLLDFSFLKNKLVLVSVVFMVAVILFLSCYGIYLKDPWFSVIPLLIFAVAFVLVREELKLIFITPITLVALYSLTKFNFASLLIEAGLVLFIANQLLTANRWFKIAGVVNYLIYAAFSIFVLHSTFFLNLLFFAGFIDRRLLFVTVLTGAYSLYFSGKHTYFLINGTKEFNLAYLALPVIYLATLLMWRKRQQTVRWMSVVSIPVFIALCYTSSPPQSTDTVITELGKNYNEINKIKAADITPVQTVRPFGYMESPVGVNDPWDIKLGTGMVVLGKYLKLIIAPYPMSYYYGYAYIEPTAFFQWLPLFFLIVHFILFLTAIVLFRKMPLVSFSILFYLIGISIFSGLVSTVPGMMGDRFLFIASIGFCILVPVLLFKVFKQDFSDSKLSIAQVKQPLKISIAVILVLYSVVTFSRNFDWKDRLTLFRKDIHAVQNSAQAQNLLGVHLMIESAKETDAAKQKAMREEAAVHFKEAVKIYPKFLNASFDLGRAYMMLGMTDNAYSTWEQTRTIDTSFVLPCYMMAAIQQNKGNFRAAAELYELYLSKYSTDFNAISNLSYVYYALGEYQQSLAAKKRVLTFSPGNFEVFSSIAQTYLQLNQKDSALVYFEQARPFNPSDAFTLQKIQELKATR